MKVFLTGGTGYLGSGIARELNAAGHDVTGLTRRAEGADALEALGVEPVVGNLRDPGSFQAAAESADALLHVAAEESDSREEVDRIAVEALLRATERSPSVLIYTSGCFVLGETGDAPAGETASTEGAPDLVAWRPPHEQRVLEAATPDLATAVIRPGMVYGGTRGVFAGFFASAERDGAVALVGDGSNRWSPVYRGDMARLYRMVMERAGRGVYHCAEPAARVADLAEAASHAAGAGGATSRRPVDEARESLGAFADALTMDQVVGWPRSRAFGWEPEHLPFLESAESVYREWKG